MSKKSKKSKIVSSEQVLAWLGDSATVEDCAELLAEIANGEYDSELFRQEVSDYEQGE